MNPPAHPLARALLELPAWLYGGAMRLRNRLYERPGATRRASLPVLSIGNVTVGGTGKTPIVAWLVQRLGAMGRRPAVVSRGYGGRAGRGPVVVSTGAGPTCSAALCGDEPYLLARALAGAIVVVGSDRLAGAEAAARAGADVVVLDDGFQHRRLARDLDVVLLDASNPFGSYRLIPAGLLREPVTALARADIVLITRSSPDDRFALIERVVRQYNSTAPILRAGHRPLGFSDPAGNPVPTPVRALAFCGIGNPSRFRIDLEALDVELVDFVTHADHHAWTADELRRLAARARAADCPLVTTEKDLVRLPPSRASGAAPALLALRIEAVLHETEPLLDAVAQALAGRGPAGHR